MSQATQLPQHIFLLLSEVFTIEVVHSVMASACSVAQPPGWHRSTPRLSLLLQCRVRSAQQCCQWHWLEVAVSLAVGHWPTKAGAYLPIELLA